MTIRVSGTEGYGETAAERVKQYESLGLCRRPSAHDASLPDHTEPRHRYRRRHGPRRGGLRRARPYRHSRGADTGAAHRGPAAASASPITWIDDSLPDLDRVHARGERYDVVMLTAVWMHLDPGQRERAMARVAPLVRPGGLMALSLRHGPVPAGRRMFDVSAEETCELAGRHGLTVIHESKGPSQLGGPAVWWDRLAFRPQR